MLCTQCAASLRLSSTQQCRMEWSIACCGGSGRGRRNGLSMGMWWRVIIGNNDVM
jgi:hypothetical protein